MEKNEYLTQLRNLKGIKDEAESNYNIVRKDTFAAMDEVGDVKWSSPGVGKATIVTNIKVKVDEVGLLAQLTPEQSAAIVTTSVDHGKLEAAVEVGLIDAELVAEFITEEAGKPYLRYTS